MFQDLSVFKTAMAMARYAGHSQAMSAQNIANADTPGYRAREMVSFQETFREISSQKATRDTHLNGQNITSIRAQERRVVADPNGNTVSLEREMLAAVDAQRQHNRAISIYRSGLNMLRISLGKS